MKKKKRNQCIVVSGESGAGELPILIMASWRHVIMYSVIMYSVMMASATMYSVTLVMNAHQLLVPPLACLRRTLIRQVTYPY